MLNIYKTTVSAVILASAALTFGTAPLAQAETLQEALISAYNNHPRLQAERARVRESDEDFVQARSQGRLSSTLTGNTGASITRRTDFGVFGAEGLATEDNFPTALQLQVIQPIYAGGRVRALKRQAEAGVFAARESLRGIEQNIFNQAATAYIDVLRDEAAARIRRNNVKVLTRQQQAAQDRFDVGEGTLTDIAQSKSRLAAAEIGLAQADSDLQSSRATYRRVIGHMPSNLTAPPQFVLPDSLQQAQRLAQNNNPQLLAALYNEQAADAGIDVAKAASKPTLSLNAAAQAARGQSSGIDRIEGAQITANISIPIFTGGLNRSRVRQASHAKTRTVFETRDTQRAIDQAVEQLWAQLEASKRSVISSQQQVESARIAFEGVVLEQQVGTRTTLDVLDAEQEALSAQLALLDAERSLNISTFQLLETLGVFEARSLQLPTDIYNPAQNHENVKYWGMKQTADKFVPKPVQEGLVSLGNQLLKPIHAGGELLDLSPDQPYLGPNDPFYEIHNTGQVQQISTIQPEIISQTVSQPQIITAAPITAPLTAQTSASYGASLSFAAQQPHQSAPLRTNAAPTIASSTQIAAANHQDSQVIDDFISTYSGLEVSPNIVQKPIVQNQVLSSPSIAADPFGEISKEIQAGFDPDPFGTISKEIQSELGTRP